MILVGGGSRSGKTRLALDLAAGMGSKLLYVATAELLDEEMRRRAEAHRAERGSRFETVEAPRDVAGAVREHVGRYDAVVIDCLTLWVSNLMLDGVGDLRAHGEELAAACSGRAVVLVTNGIRGWARCARMRRIARCGCCGLRCRKCWTAYCGK